MIALSELFNVLPPPPRVTGISFSETFSAIVVNFDAPTNLAGMQDSTDCKRIFTQKSVLKLGIGAQCSWPDASVLLATLGNNAELLNGDILSFTSTAVILASVYWRPVKQAGGIISNQRIYALDARVQSDSAMIALTSCPMPKLNCKSVMLPERAKADTTISSEKDVATADIEHFTIDGSHYLAVANHCKGRNCLFDIEVIFTTGIYDLESIIYQWKSDGTLQEHQRIATHGASDLKGFVLNDALNTGGYARRQFLAITNYRTTNTAIPDLHTQIWAWNPSTQKFVLRQKIPSVGASSVDVLEHSIDVYMVISNTGPEAYLTILRWVPGSFREDINGANYGWDDDLTFGWVPGLFLETIQTIPTDGAMSAVLFHPYIENKPAMFLAVSNYQSKGSNKVNATIYRWREEVCFDHPAAKSLNISCFDSILSIPVLGARTVTPFVVDSINYLAVANHFNGDSASEQSVHYELDSFIYSIDYTRSKESFQLHQVC